MARSLTRTFSGIRPADVPAFVAAELLGAAAAVLVFLAGNALTVALEGLIAAVQALRLAFYELFSRIFVTEGRPFVPWHVPTSPATGPSTPEVS
jgi:V/A-type H+-transporting ATPase subunit I